MIGLVIVTHGGLAVEFRAALEHIVGPQAQLILDNRWDDLNTLHAELAAIARAGDADHKL